MNVAKRRAEAALIFFGSFVVAALVVWKKHKVELLLGAIGPAAFPLAVLVFAIVASAPFSVTDALAVMNGVIFGPLWGSVVNAIGLVLAAMLGYALARRTSHLLQLEANIEKLPPWIKRFRVGSPMFLLTLRIIPGLGGTMATQIAAAFRVPVFVHVWTMCAIAVPICTLLAIFGDEAAVTVQNYYRAHGPHVHMRMPHMPRLNVPERLRNLLHRAPPLTPAPASTS